jgi:hypothetical protein
MAMDLGLDYDDQAFREFSVKLWIKASSLRKNCRHAGKADAA